MEPHSRIRWVLAIEPPRQLHLHFHGVEAEDVAAIIRKPHVYGPDDKHLVPLEQ
jgi:hypothetical protein